MCHGFCRDNSRDSAGKIVKVPQVPTLTSFVVPVLLHRQVPAIRTV